MLIPQWESKNLVFTEFSSDEAELAKSIFDSNLNVKQWTQRLGNGLSPSMKN